jgi:indole-3-glycerol phosphate synthase
MQTTVTHTILDEIVQAKHEFVEQAKQAVSLHSLQVKATHNPAPRDFLAALRNPGVQLVAEVKRASPSKGLFREELDPVSFASCYAKAGAAAISVLTDTPYFYGSLDDLRNVKQTVPLPVLRKDFLFDPYQVYEARVAGADAVLLIAAILTDQTLSQLYDLVTGLGMSALLEVHNITELHRVLKLSPEIIGINNRDLHTFRVSLDTTAEMIVNIPDSVVTVAESGIKTAQDVNRLRSLGVDAMLVGESIVTASDPAAKIQELLSGG